MEIEIVKVRDGGGFGIVEVWGVEIVGIVLAE
jgi:hypothetical protein